MPRHNQERARKGGADRALAFDAARDRAICQLDACEKAFNEALVSTAEMIRLVDSPRRATAHLATTKELRLLVRRLQRRLESA